MWTSQFGVPLINGAVCSFAAPEGLYCAGYASGSLPDQTGAGAVDAFLRRYDPDEGRVMWTKQFGTATEDGVAAVCVDPSGVYVAGCTDGVLPGQTSAGGYDAFLRKYDSSGTEVWTSQFGGADNDFAKGVCADCGGVYVVGDIERLGLDPENPDWPEYDAFVTKYDADGNEVWMKELASPDLWNQAWAVCAHSSGVYVAGEAHLDAFLTKYDGSGTELWSSQLDFSFEDSAYGVAADEGGVYVTGGTWGYDAFLRKYSHTGTVLWTRLFGAGVGTYTAGKSVCCDPTGVYVCGATNGALPGQTSAGGEDGFVRKYDADGTELWTYQFGTGRYDAIYGICAGSLFVGGGMDRVESQDQATPEASDAFVGKVHPGGPTLAAPFADRRTREWLDWLDALFNPWQRRLR